MRQKISEATKKSSVLDTDFCSLSWILVTLLLRGLGKKDHKFEANLAKHFQKGKRYIMYLTLKGSVQKR